MARPANALAAASGPMLYASLQALTLLIVARAGGVEDTAHFFLAQAVATPLGQFVSLRLKEQLATEAVPTRFVDRVGRSARVGVVIGLVGTIGWVVLAGGQLALVGIGVLWTNLAQPLIAAFQGRRARSKEFFWASQTETILGLCSAVSVAVGYAVSGLVFGVLLMAVLWWLVAAAVVTAEARRDRHVPGLLSGKDVPLRQDLVLGFARAAEVGQISVARLGTNAFAGADALAKIGTGSFFVRIGAPIVGGVRSAMGADLGDAANREEIGPMLLRVRRKLLRFAVVGAVLGGALGWLVIRPIIALTYGEAVSPAPSTAAFLLSGAAFLYTSMLMGQATIAKGARKSVLWANLGALGTSAVLVGPLGVLWGEAGAAAALAAGYVARFAALYRIMGSDDDVENVPVGRAVALLSAVGVIAFGGALLWRIYSPATGEPPAEVDAVFVLAGGRGERLAVAEQLHAAHSESELVLSLPPDWDGRASGAVRKACATDETVRCLDPDPPSTAGEIVSIDAYATENSMAAVVIVTSDSHVERVRRWVERCGTVENITVIGSPMEYHRARVQREFLASLDSLVTQRSCPG